MDSREPREDHELAAFRKWARQVSVAFVNLSGGGSEMFTRIGNEFYVDPDPCAARIKEKIDAARLLRPSPVAESTPTDATAVEAEREGWSKNAAGVKDGARCYRTIGGVRWEWWAEDAALFKAAGVRHRRAPDGQGTFVHPDDEQAALAAIRARTPKES